MWEPRKELFVLLEADASALRDIERHWLELGSVEKLPPDVVVLRVQKPRATARESWQQTQLELENRAWVVPVLADVDGSLHYPTGTIQVRFTEARTDDELERFAAENCLELIGRNEFVGSQASFAISKAARGFLPDLVEAIGGNPLVRRAWPDTKSHYRRR